MSIQTSDETWGITRKPRITWEGWSVLFDINDGDRMLFARLTAGSKVKIGNMNCSLQPLIGCPFGSSFQVEVGNHEPFLSRISTSTKEKMDVDRDNRAIVDNNTAQSLTGEDINDMRSKGATGDEIIEALMAKSATFEKKTAFSQDQEAEKICSQSAFETPYCPKVNLVQSSYVKLTSRNMQKKIGFLRMDTLSLLLSLANVTAHSDVLVVDMLDGMITGAVAKHLGGTGYVCNAHYGIMSYPINIVRIFNFNVEIYKRIVHSSLIDLRPSGEGDAVGQIGDACGIQSEQNEEILSFSAINSVSMEENHEENTDISANKAPPKTCKSIRAGEKTPVEAITSWKENGFSSLIITAPDLDAWSIAKEVLPLLSYSAPFAIYHQYLEPLAACMHNLQTEKMAIGLQISEPWLREYLVLPSRTHPHMQMSSSGYILSGLGTGCM